MAVAALFAAISAERAWAPIGPRFAIEEGGRDRQGMTHSRTQLRVRIAMQHHALALTCPVHVLRCRPAGHSFVQTTSGPPRALLHPDFVFDAPLD